jgi:hypothetical protein
VLFPLFWRACQLGPKLIFSLVHFRYGHTSHRQDTRIVVYAVTVEAANLWNTNALSWKSQPACHPRAGFLNQPKTVRAGGVHCAARRADRRFFGGQFVFDRANEREGESFAYAHFVL